MARKIDFYGLKAVREGDDIIVGAGDVETEGLGGSLLMIQWGLFGEIYTESGPDMIERFFNFALQWPKPVIWYFHFGQYDWRYFLDYFIANQLDVEIGMRTETDIYEIRISVESGTVVLRDSFALWPNSLASLANSFCPELPKLEIDIENFDPKNEEHIKYARRDIEILLVGLPRLFDKIHDHFGINPGPTTAGTALRAWQKTLTEGEIYKTAEMNEKEIFIRQGYYGGLVFLTSQNIFQDCETYDLNSSYPASMDEYGVPYGRAISTRQWEGDGMGMFRVRVKTPDDIIVPILPARDNRGRMRWFRGEFETVVTNRELIFAVQNGYKVLKLYEGIKYDEVVFPFHEIIAKCKEIRFAFKGTGEETLAKLIQNSIYGKFGTRRERTKMLCAWSDLKPDDIIGAIPFDEEGNWLVKKEYSDDMVCMPAWSAFITAHSRLRLLQAVYSIGPENCIYGDTDSITVKRGFADKLNVGPEYGQWKLEKRWQIFRAIAPKVYAGILDDGSYKGAGKGLPRKAITGQHWRELIKDGSTTASALSLPSLKVAFKRGLSPAEIMTRRSSSLTNSINFESLPSGDVRLKLNNE